MRNFLFAALIAVAGWWPATGRAQAILTPLPRLELLFLYADQSPRLADGDSTVTGIESAIRSRLAYQPTGKEADMAWYSASVTFTIGADGRVRDVRVLPREAPRFEQAVLAATRRLPRFVPGRRQGQAVAVRYTLSVGLAGTSHDNSHDGGVRLPPDWDDVEKWVQQPPHLPGNEKLYEALYAELQRLPAVPASTTHYNWVEFRLTIDKTGQPLDFLVINHADLAHCQALVQALRQLPRFEPGRDADGQPVAVRLDTNVNFPSPGAPLQPRAAPATSRPAAAKISRPAPMQVAAPPAFDPHKVFPYVEQMPRLRAGAGYQDVGQAIRQRMVLPAGAACTGRVWVSFIINANGAVTKPRVARGVAPACDAAVLAATRKLPRFEPGKQNGVQVAVDYMAPVLLGQ